MADTPTGLRPIRPIARHPFVEDVLPIIAEGAPRAEGPGPKDPPHPHPHPVKPCVGHGMNTDARAEKYVHQSRQLQKEWGHLALKDRMARMQSLANQQLHSQGTAPLLQMKLTPNERPFFNQQDWSMNIIQSCVQATQLNDADAKYLASSTYHETRHAEQTYLAIRKHAADLERTGGYHSARLRQKIMNDLRVPYGVADHAARHPLHKDDPLYPCASVMYETLFGSGTAQEQRVYTRLAAADKAVTDSKAEFDRVSDADGRIEKKQNALRGTERWVGPTELAANNAVDPAFKHWQVEKYLHLQPEQDYLSLPNESDAYDSQQKVEKAWDGAPQVWFP